METITIQINGEERSVDAIFSKLNNYNSFAELSCLVVYYSTIEEAETDLKGALKAFKHDYIKEVATLSKDGRTLEFDGAKATIQID